MGGKLCRVWAASLILLMIGCLGRTDVVRDANDTQLSVSGRTEKPEPFIEYTYSDHYGAFCLATIHVDGQVSISGELCPDLDTTSFSLPVDQLTALSELVMRADYYELHRYYAPVLG